MFMQRPAASPARRAVEDVLRDHVVATLGDHVAGVLDHLGAADDGRHRRVVLEVLEHLVASM